MNVYRNLSKIQLDSLIIRPYVDQRNLRRLIENVFENVEANGDKAILAYSKKFDGIAPAQLLLDKDALNLRASSISPNLKESIKVATKNIRKFHKDQLNKSRKIETVKGVVCWKQNLPIQKVGLYVPGGTAPLVSTVLMLGIPAQIAGCQEVILCTPPDKNGEISPAICYAALAVGIDKVVVVGGAQAIAAMTIGTKSVKKVDKLFGPGNQYVTEAKKYAQNLGVASDMPAGPSEVMVIADSNADSSFIAADLLSQAEHGIDSQVVLVTPSDKLITDVQNEIDKQLQSLPRKKIARGALKNSFFLKVLDIDAAIDFSNQYAPEHLILNVRDSYQYLSKILNAGSVFLGQYSPESAGDYASGTNHTLPTNGWARSYSGLSVNDYSKTISFQSITRQGLKTLAPAIIELSRTEGLEAHARAVSIRLRK